MQSAPQLSCVIPTYNDRFNLAAAVDSALSQPGVRVEVVLVDDCSDEPTRDFIRKLAARDARIRPFFLQRNGGQGQARNVGAMVAQGEFVAFLDQDDRHAQGWYLSALDILASNPGLGGISGRARIIDIPSRFGIDETDLRLRGLSLVFVTNIVLRRSVFLASGGFPTGDIWRGRVAGEDGVYRESLSVNWHFAQCDHDALIHHAKEGGATVFFLDRSEVRADQVVITRLEEIEATGQLQKAHDAFQARAKAMARDVGGCVK